MFNKNQQTKCTDSNNKPVSEGVKLFYFTLYTIAYESIVWGLFGYLMIFHDWSEWTVIVAMVLSAAQLPSKRFGVVTYKDPAKMTNDEFKKYGAAKKMEYAIEEQKAKNRHCPEIEDAEIIS